MKAVLTICAVALIAWAMAPDTAVAQYGDENVWMDTLIGGVYTGIWDTEWDGDDPLALARVIRYGNFIDSACNKKTWVIDVTVEASIAQWVHWTLNRQGWSWRVKKPGCYAANCISFWVASNGDIVIDYDQFNNLTADPPNMHENEIDTWYSWGSSITSAEANGWVMADLLNLDDDTLIEAELYTYPFDLHDGIDFKLWNKICVDTSNTACEYYDDAEIRLVLEQQKTWLDDNGDWIIP